MPGSRAHHFVGYPTIVPAPVLMVVLDIFAMQALSQVEDENKEKDEAEQRTCAASASLGIIASRSR